MEMNNILTWLNLSIMLMNELPLETDNEISFALVSKDIFAIFYSIKIQ